MKTKSNKSIKKPKKTKSIYINILKLDVLILKIFF
jgi:hypothetical protein